MSKWMNLLPILIGLYALAGAIFNWEWFFSARRVAILVRLFTRTGARILYALIGLLLIGVGIASFLGIIG
jgi:hypothetical protein